MKILMSELRRLIRESLSDPDGSSVDADNNFPEYEQFVEKINDLMRRSAEKISSVGVRPNDPIFEELKFPNWPSWVETGIYDLLTQYYMENANFTAIRLPFMSYFYESAKEEIENHTKFFADLESVLGAFVQHVIKKFEKQSELRSGSAFDEFGKYVFADQRAGTVPNEQNTPIEDKVYNSLRRHINNNVPMTSDVTAPLIKSLDSDAYPEILHEPSDDFIFRGIKVNHDFLEKLLDKVAIPPRGARTVSKTVRGKGDQDGYSTSWSTFWTAAMNFATNQENQKDFSVILVAKVSENPDIFLEGPDGFYKIPPLSGLSYEKETIALGPVKLCAVFWSYDDYDFEISFPEFSTSLIQRQ